MVSLRHRSRFYRFIWELGHSPLKLLELLQYFALGWVLLLTLVGFGGFLAYGEPMVGVSRSLIILAGLHALVIVFRERRPGIEWPLILPVPFLLYAWAHFQFLSPTPWEAGPLLVVYVQAYALYFIVYHSIHGRRSLNWVLGVFQLVVGVALLAAFFQFYAFPDWMPALGRVRNPAYGAGAAGFLQDPVNLGMLLILCFPLCILLMAKNYRVGPSWVFQGFFGLALLMGLFLCAHIPGLIVVTLVLLMLPVFMSGYGRTRKRLWKYGFLVLAVSALFVWLGTEALRERFLYYLNFPWDPLAEASRSIAWAQFKANGFFGQGLGSYSMFWDAFASKGLEGRSLYPHSAYLGILAEMGIVGLLLILVPFGILFWKGFSKWKQLPHLWLNKEVAGRLEKLPSRHPSRRRLEKDKGKVPTPKVILGALLLGGLAGLIYASWEYSYTLPVILFAMAFLAAILASVSGSRPESGEKGRVWIVVSILPMLLCVWASSFGVPRFYASQLVYTASEHLSIVEADPDQIFEDPAVTAFIESQFALAANLVPDHAIAWEGMGRARLADLYAELESASAIAEDASEDLGKAISLAPDSWRIQYNIGRILALKGASAIEVKAALSKAMELGPYRPEPLSFFGNLLLLEDPRSSQGIAYLKQAIAIDPTYGPALNTLQGLGVSEVDPDSLNPGEHVDILNLSIIGQQHPLLPEPPEGVLGAGLVEIEDWVNSLLVD